MKRNVDLTQNRTFSRFRDGFITINDMINSHFRGKVPWEFIWDDNYWNEQSLVFTGNRYDRKLKKECILTDNGRFCDCCGGIVNRKPWVRKFGTCEKCDEYYSKDILNSKDRCLWRKNEMIRNANVFNMQ